LESEPEAQPGQDVTLKVNSRAHAHDIDYRIAAAERVGKEAIDTAWRVRSA
jgi:hypothetical protein